MNKLLTLFCLILLSACMTKTEAPDPTIPMLIGTYTGGISEGVYRIDFNPEDGSFGEAFLMAKTENPSYLALSRITQKVYVVNENDPGTISTFDWNGKGSLNLLSTKSVEGRHPCHVSVHPNNSLVSVANYSSGNISVFEAEGELLEGASFHQHEGVGTHPRQEAPHAHFSTFSQDGRYLYAIDLGIDEVKVYDIDGGQVDTVRTAFKTDPADGPRHLDFHPTLDIVYVLNELSNSVSVCKVLDDGTFERVNKLSALPEGYEGESKSADIHVSADGKFLYYSNRGHNSIATFLITPKGDLDLIGFQQEGIANPRSFSLTPDGQYLVVANQDTDNLVSFKVEATGLLSPTGHTVKVGTPVCVKFY